MSAIRKMIKNMRVSTRGVNHRRQRMVTRGLLSFLGQRLMDDLYYIGATAERQSKRFRRSTRHASARAFTAIGGACAAAWDYVKTSVISIVDDLVNPFIKMWRSTKSFFSVMREMKDASFSAKMYRVRAFFRYGWLWNKHLIGRFASRVLPVVCGIVCVVTIRSILDLNYVVAVSYNGNEVGYVKNESVYDAAVKMIDERIINVGDSFWKPSTVLTISVADEEEVSDEETMANNILSNSGSEIVEATGLYVGGQFFGATTAGSLLTDKLETVLEPYEEQAKSIGENVSVKFAREVRLETGIYPADSIVSYDSICSVIDSDEEKDIYYEARDGEPIQDIVNANGITLEDLKKYNPEEDLSQDVIQRDCTLLVAKSEPLFSVKMVGTITKVTSIPYDSIITKSSNYDLGYYYLVSNGSKGERTTTIEVIYRDGKEISREVISEKVTKQPVNQEIIVGIGGSSGGSVGSGVFHWPTGSYLYISANFGWRTLRGAANYHTGLDIAANEGTPIYAADNGIVTTAAYTSTGYGIHVIIDHQNGIVTLYGHASALLVDVGEVVYKGQTIALVGSTGNSTGDHLHFEVRVHGTAVDPWIYLS